VNPLRFVDDPQLRLGRLSLDLGVVIAFAWLFAAAGLSLVFGPRLGLRGWCWLLAHHLLCLAGVTHELRRGWRRHKARAHQRHTATTSAPGAS